MKKIKLNLNDLKIKSFVTTLISHDKKNIVGGDITNGCASVEQSGTCDCNQKKTKDIQKCLQSDRTHC